MTFTQAVDAIYAATVHNDTAGVEALARMVPVLAPTEAEGIVGAALERSLREHYRTMWAGESDARLFELSEFAGETYPDRVARAKSDVMHELLEQRHPNADDPIDSWNDGSGLSWRQHLMTVYGV